MQKSEQVNYWIGAICVFFAAFGFAAKGIFIKSAYQYKIDTISLLTLRFLFSIPFYAIILLQKRVREKHYQSFDNITWGRILFLGFIGYYLSAYINFLGLNYITASLERILLFIYPTFVLLIGVVRFRRKITKLQFWALGITYLGILMAFLENLAEDEQKNIYLGAFLVVLSGLFYSFYLVGSDKLLATIGSLKFTCWVMIFAAFPTLVHCYSVNRLAIFHFPMPVYTISLSMAIFATVLPTFLIAEGIRRVGSGNAAIIASIGPIFTIFLATFFLNEHISWVQVLGTLLVLMGVFLISWKGQKL